ncbi:MAG: hypothetical protein ACQERD_11795, partial [Campylobacterota bacterium]
SKSHRAAYCIALQTIRIVGLLHDVGHLPFSHQIEYALKKVYYKIIEKQQNNSPLLQREIEFKNTYESITDFTKNVLHEAIGNELLKLLFGYELEELLKKQSDKEYIKLIEKLSLLIFEEKIFNNFDFGVLHKFIDSTVDADRLDYINRDMLASGYITGPSDHIRITKQSVLVKDNDKFLLSFSDMALIDIEHMLEMRFNLYKKVIYNHGIAKTDALLENVVQYLSNNYFNNRINSANNEDNISMLWNFKKENSEEQLDTISLLDENWLISLFKKEYFFIKKKQKQTTTDKKYLYCFEEVLFGKRRFKSHWKNLNEFYKELEFQTVQRYKFRESFGYITEHKATILQKELDEFIKRWENKKEDVFFTYKIVSFKIGIQKNFCLYDNESLISIDEVSTLRKRLKQSMLNTVPFYIYSNKKSLSDKMKKELKEIILKIFS